MHAPLDVDPSRYEPTDAYTRNASLPLLTLSVVLPCAMEHRFMRPTARSVFAATPPDILHEIIVVDDGSTPPLAPTFPDAASYKVRIVRHEATLGLIGAKKTGGDAATGDIIVFFDCHVKPAAGYWEPFVAHVAENYRRVVVPTITSLDVTTWVESSRPRGGGGGMSKCYLTFDAEFKWTNDATAFVPVMSGGLLAMSRRWWAETGGYDAEMHGWGGENLDQSLRIWRCGGEIVTAPTSYVAHMWRTGDKLTRARYVVPGGSAQLNRARAAKAHMGDWFVPKVLTFPAFRRFAPTRGDELEVGAMANPPGLSCRPFEWYLRRFAHIYADGGVLPRQVYQLSAAPAAGGPPRCLQLRAHNEWGNAFAPSDVLELAACEDGQKPNSRQWWHAANRLPNGRCCGGLRSWNSDQCLTAGGSALRTAVCSLEGSPSQRAALDDDGLLRVGGRSCAIAPAGLGAVTLGSCRNGATVWARRAAFEPPEFAMLSSQSRDAWPEPGGEQAPAVEEAAEEWLRWHKRHQHFAAGAAVELRD